MSSLKRGRDMDNQAWYAVLRHRRGNPDTRFAVTYPYCCTLSTLPGCELEPIANARGGSSIGKGLSLGGLVRSFFLFVALFGLEPTFAVRRRAFS
jgi:hypothetical protein